MMKYLVELVDEGDYLLHHEVAADYVKLLRSTTERYFSQIDSHLLCGDFQGIV